MSKEFISNTVLEARVFYSTQTTFSGGLQGIQLSQAGEVAAIAGRIAASQGVGGVGQGTVATIGQIAVLPDAGREPAYQGDVQATIGRITVPTIGMGYAGDVATIINEVSVGTWVRLGRQGGEAAATIGQTVVSVVAELTDLNRRDVSNTLEFASRYADSLVPMGEDSASWSWFHNFTSAIPQLGWTAHTTGPQDVNLQTMPTSGDTIADLIVGIASTDSTFDSTQRQIIQRTMDAMTLAAATGTMRMFDQSKTSSTEQSKSFTVTAVSVKNGLLTMRTIGLEFQSTEGAVNDNGKFSPVLAASSRSIRKEIIDFTAIQPFLDAHRGDVEQKLQGDVASYIENTLLD